MKGFQVVEFIDKVPIKKIELVSESPLVFRAFGSRFATVYKALLNGIETPFEIYSDYVMDMQVPDALSGAIIRNVEAFSKTLTGQSQDTQAEMRAGITCLEGASLTTQRYIKLMLTNPGSDAFHKAAGGGLQQIIGTNFDIDNPSPLIGHITTAVQRTTDQVIASQIMQKRNAEGRLNFARLLDVGFDQSRMAFNFQVLLTFASGLQTVSRFGMAPAAE